MTLRIAKLRQLLRDHQLDAVLVSKPENRCYFSNFTGSSGVLLITDTTAQLITDFRYIEQAAKQATGFEILRHGPKMLDTVRQAAAEQHVKTLGFETDFVTVETYHSLQEQLPGIKFTPTKLDSLRMVKDHQELVALQQAVAIADKAFLHILSFIKPGLTENQVALELEYTMRRLGAEKLAFDIIVASGIRSSLPHGRATDKVIVSGDFVTMDFGAVYGGYHSDITRTIVMGKATDRQREIYGIVSHAQLAGVQAVRPGQTGREVDDMARTVITEAGYGAYFGHGLGHGVGLVIHEDPRLSPAGEVVLEPGMTVTVEPGIYLPEWGGVRIEDTVVVTTEGCQILTASSKQLIEIV